MAEESKDIKAIFAEALEKSIPEERVAYLDQVCGTNAPLREQVEILLNAHEQAGDDFLESPAVGEEVTLDGSLLIEVPGTVIGPYKLLEKIGEGGMAVVYMAEQHKPFHRRVALKIIKLGMDTKQVISRFGAERQALAMMDHPNIAKVFDAGATDTGRPYFVMELVRGLTVTEYCDKNKLNTQERLALLIPVCNAVQHAHQKGIIHRDIKPSNIMVTLHDGKPVPKVIDFGIAKATNQRLTERTVFTRYAEMIGTPEYMSPEQAEMSGLDVDTRTDIYSLGVVLYELLTGVLPFDPHTLRAAAMGEIQRIIREEEPPRPSTRFSTLGERAQEIAASRCTNIAMLTKRLHRELEWIPMKAMRKDRTRRYRSASELADDIGNYLNGTPLIAGPESTIYKLRKSMRRNRALVMGLAAILAVVVAGVVVSTVFAVRAKRQAMISQAVADFLTNDLLGSVAPEKAKSPEVTVHSVLDAASKSLVGKFEGKPLIEASIREKLAETYRKLGDYQAAEPHLERAYRIRAEQLGEEDILTLTSVHQLGRLYLIQARVDDAEPLLVGAWKKRRRLLGERHPDTLTSAAQVAYLSFIFGSSAVSDVEGLFARTIETARGVLGDEHVVTLDAMLGLSLVYFSSGRHEEAELLFVRGLETAERALSAEHELTLQFMNSLALLHLSRREVGQSIPLVTRTFEISQRVLGHEHPTTIHSMFMRGLTYAFQGQIDQAESMIQESVQLSRRILGDEHFWTLFYTQKLAHIYRDLGRYEDAEPLFVKVIEGQLRLRGEAHRDTQLIITELGKMYVDNGLHDAAEQLFIETLERRQLLLGEKDSLTQASIADLCRLYELSGQLDKLKTIQLRQTVPQDRVGKLRDTPGK